MVLLIVAWLLPESIMMMPSTPAQIEGIDPTGNSGDGLVAPVIRIEPAVSVSVELPLRDKPTPGLATPLIRMAAKG